MKAVQNKSYMPMFMINTDDSCCTVLNNLNPVTNNSYDILDLVC